MKIAGYLKTSLIEWPGKITSVIFVPGCNFRCPFCHNADLADPERCRRLPLIPEKEIFEDLGKRKKWIDGVVITGGEPTLQPDLPNFLGKIKKMGYLTMVQTNGSLPEVITKLLSQKWVDYLTVDIKGDLNHYGKYIKTQSAKRVPPSHQGGTMAAHGKTQNFKRKIESSLKLLLTGGMECELRTTVVPGLHNKEVLVNMAKSLKKITANYKLPTANCRWFLQTFWPRNCLDPAYGKVRPYNKKQMEGFLKVVKRIFPQADLRSP